MRLRRLMVAIGSILVLLIISIRPGIASQPFTLFGAANIPFTLVTGNSTTGITGPVLQSYSDAGCTTSFVNFGQWAGGLFAVSSNTTRTYYMSTIDGPGGGGGTSLAVLLCPDGTTNNYVKFDQLYNQNANACTINTPGCFTMSCTGTGAVSGSVSGTLPTITCP